jgi:hypothetical protein
VQALLEAMAPIRGADFRDRAASFKFACERLQLLGEVLATSHVIEHASVLTVKARVLALTADAQGIVVDFARDVLIQRQNASDLTLDGISLLASVGDSSTSAVRASIEAHYSY